MRHTALALILSAVWSAAAIAAPTDTNTTQTKQSTSVTHLRIDASGKVVDETGTAVGASASNKALVQPDAAAPASAQVKPSAAQPSPVQAQPAVATQPLHPQPSGAQVQQGQKTHSSAAQGAQDSLNQPFKGKAMAASLYGGTGGVRQVSAPGVPPAGPRRGVEAQTLPGVGVMPGDAPELQNNVIRVSSDRTSIVNISGTLTNRIATPFEKPKAILLDGNASVKAVGQSIYIAPNGSPDPISLYVTGSGTNDPVVSLTLVPKSVPPQTVVLQMDGPAAPTEGTGSGGSRTDYKDSSYSKQIVSTLRSLALGRVPSGYAEGMLPKAVANLGNVVAIPLARYSGPYFDVYRYRIEAMTAGEIEMEESAFWTQGVRAVSLFPSGVVSKGHPTQVFVIADKSATVSGVAR